MTATPTDLLRSAHLQEKAKEAVGRIDVALAADGPVREMAEADALERNVVALRDALIDLVRHDPDAREQKKARAALDHVNAVLSLISGVEYPSKGPEPQLLKEAKAELRRLLRTALFRAE